MQMRIAVLASGRLGLTILKGLANIWEISFVMTDKNSQELISYCLSGNVPYYIGNPRNEKSKDFYQPQKVDVLVSVNYLFLIDKELIRHPENISFNVHGSLLPKYRGRTPHVWAIINNEKKTGVTAHIIDEGCDTGDILDQIDIPIENDDTGADILIKYEKAYLPLIQNVLEKIQLGKIERKKQDDTKATYFGKRTPEDGKINWDWQKERIYNWVRAQADPYPGAFTYLDGHKIIIDKIVFDEWGFSHDMINGLIITTNPLRVKTPNGVVQLKNTRGLPDIISKHKILS